MELTGHKGTKGYRVTLRQDRGRDGTPSGRRGADGNTERREVVMGFVHDRCHGEYGRMSWDLFMIDDVARIG